MAVAAEDVADEKKYLQIIIPICILIIIGTIWFIKNQNASPLQSNPSSAVQNDPSTLPQHLQNADFSLAITEAVDFDVLSEYGIPAIIDYGADSCVPCKQMAPVLEKLNKEMYGKAFIKFVDVWQYTEAASNVPVQVIPTQVLVNSDGTPFVPSDALSAQIEFTMYEHRDTGEHIYTVHQGGLTEEQMRLILEEMGVK